LPFVGRKDEVKNARITAASRTAQGRVAGILALNFTVTSL